MASETTFDHWKVVFSWGKMRKSQFSQNPLTSRFWAFGFLIYTSSSTNFKKKIHRDTFFFVSVHVPATSVVYCNENLRWSTGECIIVYYSAQWVIVQVSYSPAPQSTPPTRPIPGILTRQHSLKFILLSMNISEIQKYLNILEIHNPTFYISLMKCISTKIPRSSQNTRMLGEVWKFGPEIPNG